LFSMRGFVRRWTRQVLLLCCTLAVACPRFTCSTLAPSPNSTAARVRWYVNGDVAENVAFAVAYPDALTGFYLCCGILGVDDDGVASYGKGLNASKLRAMVSAMQNPANRADGGAPPLTVHAVFGVSEAAIHSGRALNGAVGIASLAAAAGLDGVLCDYEPADNYTMAHAQAYADFLDAVAKAATASSELEVGMDVAGWGILGGDDFMSVYAKTGIAFATSMTPTYSAANVTTDEVFARQLLAHFGARGSVGIGSVAAPGFESKCRNMPAYLWTNETLTAFLDFVRDETSELGADVWRCDIDHYGKTADWFVDGIAAFGRGRGGDGAATSVPRGGGGATALRLL
jgi:hypothetical protein